MRKLFSLLFITTISLCFGKIIETKNFSEIYDHIDKNTLIVLDIDDTLLIPTQNLIYIKRRKKIPRKSNKSFLAVRLKSSSSFNCNSVSNFNSNLPNQNDPCGET